MAFGSLQNAPLFTISFVHIGKFSKVPAIARVLAGTCSGKHPSRKAESICAAERQTLRIWNFEECQEFIIT